ncbi:MAG: hypothetical protein ACTHU0_37530 [Kofleriaceae bacterium]
MPTERAKRLMLRGFCLISLALGLALLVVGALPGAEIWHPVRDVPGVQSASAPLLPLESVPVANVPFHLVWLAAMLAPGLLAWRRPKLRHALLWSLISVGGAMFGLALSTHGHDCGGRIVELEAKRVYDVLLFALLAVQIVVIPLACAAFALATRPRGEPRPERIARAHVHRIRAR